MPGTGVGVTVAGAELEVGVEIEIELEVKVGVGSESEIEDAMIDDVSVEEGLGVVFGADAAVLFGRRKNAPTTRQPIQKTAAAATTIAPISNRLFSGGKDGACAAEYEGYSGG